MDSIWTKRWEYIQNFRIDLEVVSHTELDIDQAKKFLSELDFLVGDPVGCHDEVLVGDFGWIIEVDIVGVIGVGDCAWKKLTRSIRPSYIYNFKMYCSRIFTVGDFPNKHFVVEQ